ncbi:hypothetical protein [Oceanihabitans sediminis]|nr:hypothetical protein [Oceanihabitans sediminis]MDX1773995.1 hypothetical protein [Oceanihabitans sediminis]
MLFHQKPKNMNIRLMEEILDFQEELEAVDHSEETKMPLEIKSFDL